MRKWNHSRCPRKRDGKDYMLISTGVLVILLILGYIAGRLALARLQYDSYLETGIMSETGHTVMQTLRAAVTTGYGRSLLGCFAVAAGLGILWLKFFHRGRGVYDTDRNMYISQEGTYGSAGWMSKQEARSELAFASPAGAEGIVLGALDGKAVCLPPDSRLNRHIAVYGATGTMKSRAFVRPYVFGAARRGESIILTDSKGELYTDLAGFLKDNGYTVKVFNLVSPAHSDAWNCLGEIGDDELMAQTFTQIIIENTREGQRSDHFWDSAEANLLKALALYVQLDNSLPRSQKNIGYMYKLLINQSEAALDALFEVLPNEHPARNPYAIFKQSSATIRSSVIVGLGSRLQVLQNEAIRRITSTDDIDLTLPAKGKCAYFCIISDQDSTLAFLSSLFFSFLFVKLVRYADTQTQNGRCDKAVNIVLDEFTQVGHILDIHKKISVIRSRNIHLSLIFQNIGQLQNRYPDNVWLELLGACDTQLYLGCTDPMTAEYVSARTGEITVSTSGQRYTQAPLFRSPVHGDLYSQGRRRLLTPDEVIRLPNNEALIFLRGHNTLRLQKLDYTAYPEARLLRPKPVSSYTPEWQAWPDTGRQEEFFAAREPEKPAAPPQGRIIRRRDIFH